MPSPRRRSRDRRSRSRSRQRRSPPRRSRSRSPRRRSRSPRRSRTHSPHRRPIRRSRSRTRRSFSPRHRRSPSPKGHPRRPPPPPPRRRSSGRRSPGRRSLSPRGGYSQRRSYSPRGRPQGRRSPRRSPKRVNSGQRQSPHSSTDAKRVKSRSPYKELSPVRRESPPNYKGRSPSPQLSPRVHHKNDLLIGGITVNTPIKRLMLTDRFQTEEQRDQGDIVIEDNIVIAIQRGLNVVNSSPVEINREFDPDNVVIIRQKDEGKTPIFDREEIKMFGFDSMEDDNAVEEKRIISVIPQSRRHKSPEVIRKIKQKQKVQLDFRPDPKYEPLIKYRGIKDDDEEKETYRIKRVEKNPNDLRHSLSKRRHDDGDRFDARKKLDARRGSDLGQREGERVFARLGDTSKERKRERSREKRPERLTSGRSRDSRSSRDRKDKSDGKNLPDFKNRPDKFKYEEWKEKPEMIPRNPSYFEHDNREGERGFRGRGRGFRGRPPPRGSYRGRGGFGGSFRGGFGGGFKGGRGGSSLRDREWKHDLFDKLKDDEEEKPSSTTKN